MSRSPRLLAAVLVCVLAAACSPGDVGDGGKKPAKDTSLSIKPPPEADPNLRARVGIIVVTNSGSFKKLLGSSVERGITVLYVQPGGPASGIDMQAGDVITKIDGREVFNAERGVVMLRSRRDQRRNLEISKVGGDKKSVAIVAKEPGDERSTTQKKLDELNQQMKDRPDDPIPYFLRAQEATRSFNDRLADAEKAVEVSPGFVEAISLRAETLFNQSNLEKSADKKTEYRDRAFTDWDVALKQDPQNTRVLAARGQASDTVGQYASAKRDGEKARAADATFPAAHYVIGVSNLLLAKYKEAPEPARKAIELNPYDVKYYSTLATAFLQLKRPADARKTVEAIIELVPSGPTKDRLLRIAEGKLK